MRVDIAAVANIVTLRIGMSTLREVAEKAGMAVTSVSEILRDKPGYSGATRKRVQALAASMGYRPNASARQLRGGRSGVIGVLVGLDDPQVNYDRLTQLERLAFARGYRLLVGQVEAGDDKAGLYLEDFAGRGVDGLIWLPQPFLRAPRMPSALYAGLGCVVALDQPLAHAGGCVRVDYGAGILQAVRHLRARGRRRIGLALAGTGRRGDPLDQRRTAFLKSMKRIGAGARGGPMWIGRMVERPTADLVRSALDRLLRRERADAIIASNDIWAAAFLKALRGRGARVPDDVAVVGFDNLNFSELLDPALTTVDQNHDAFARAALDLVIRLSAGERLAEKERVAIVTPRLVARASS
jgi:DNA-binding LacI/PurR family transcriptional regulator